MMYNPENKVQAFAQSVKIQCTLNREADDDIAWETEVDQKPALHLTAAP